MRFRPDSRAQSIQIGAVLMFGIIIILLSLYQAFVVPSQNEEVELDHNQNVQQDMTELRNSVVSTTSDSGGRSVSIRLGTSYPSRTVFVNPGPPSGALRTVGTQERAINITIENATATGDAGDFWNGNPRAYSSGSIVYQPNYNVYQRPPRTVYENTVLYNEFRGANVTLTGQRLVNDRTIRLAALNGSLSTSQSGTTSVDVSAVSSSSNRVAVRNVSANSPVTLTIPSQLNASTWEDLFAEELVGEGGNVVSVEQTNTLADSNLRLIQVTLREDVSYRLQMSRVGVGTGVDESTESAYLQTIGGGGASVPENSEQTVTVEARDGYNNPVAGEILQATVENGDVTNVTQTDAEGQAELTYESPDIDGGTEQALVNVSIDHDPATSGDNFDAAAPLNVTINLTVENTDRSGTSAGGTTGPYSISFNETSIANEPGVTQNGDIFRYNLAADGDSAFNLTAETDPQVFDADVDFGLNRTDLGTFNSQDGSTDKNGEAVATFGFQDTGSLQSFVTSGGSGDTVDINITNTASDIVISALQPSADGLSDYDGEFIRVYFPNSVDDASEYLLSDDDGTLVDFTSSLPQGEVYVAGDEDVFAKYWSIDPSRVEEFESGNRVLNNGGESIKLNRSGDTIDQVAYGSQTTTRNWAITIPDSKVGYRIQSGGSYVDTDNESDWRNQSEADFFGDSNGGFSSVNVTDILPNATGQEQSFIVTLDDPLPAGESLSINLDDAQQTSPFQVDYQGSIGANLTLDNSNQDGAEYNKIQFPSEVSAETTIRLNVTGINASREDQQDDPYTVVFERSDHGFNSTAEFNVTGDNGSPAISNLAAEDLFTDTDGQTQNITFQLDSDLPAGVGLTVDLTAAQDSNVPKVDYTGDVTTNLSAQENTNTDTADTRASLNKIRFDSDLSAGTGIELQVDDVNVGPDSGQTDPYEVAVSRGDAGTANTTFEVGPSNFDVNITGTNSPVTAGETLNVSVDVNNTGDIQDTQTIRLYNDTGSNNTELDSQTVSNLAPGDSPASITLQWNTTTGESGDDLQINVTSEDDFATDSVTVDAAENLVAGSVSTSNTVLEFNMANQGTQQVTIEQFSVDATAIDSGITIETSTSADEVEITGSTQDGIARTKNNDVLQADGTTYDFQNAAELNNGNSQYAIIASGDTVTVDIREFSQRLDNGGSNPLQFTNSPSDADVVVTFVLSDGSVEEFYLEQS